MTDLNQLLPYRVRKRVFQTGLYGSALLIVFMFLFPIYWIAQNAFKTKKEIIASSITYLPSADSFTLANFSILTSRSVDIYITNTILATAGTIVLSVIFSLIAGYGLARFRFRGKVVFARVLLFGYMFSPIVLALPLYEIWTAMGMLNEIYGLVLALTATSMPFSVWLMWKYIQTIPESMEERAWIEGASRGRAVFDVILPQTKPAVVAVALWSFALAWTDFTFAQILLPARDATTFAPGMMRLVSNQMGTSYAEIMAALLLMAAPPLIFAYFLQSYLLKGFQIRSL
jgi:multiple sugar transport system permease protein